MIRAFLVDEQEEWDLHLGCIAGAYRMTPHETTSLSPNLMCLGREIRVPADLIYNYANEESNPVTSCDEYVQYLRDCMLRAHLIARRLLRTRAERSKEIYDTNVVHHSYKRGDFVWYLHENRKIGVCPKLERLY